MRSVVTSFIACCAPDQSSGGSMSRSARRSWAKMLAFGHRSSSDSADSSAERGRTMRLNRSTTRRILS